MCDSLVVFLNHVFSLSTTRPAKLLKSESTWLAKATTRLSSGSDSVVIVMGYLAVSSSYVITYRVPGI